MTAIPSRYNPAAVEDARRQTWEAAHLFHAKADRRKKPFTIVIPPPNVTGILHMGHALNNTLQDILVRYKRMRGFTTLWMPGTDHAGIATQNVVEKQLAKEGRSRHDFSREDFIQRLWDWKRQYGDTIIHQLKKLGSSCDWDRLRFTMDDDYSRAVQAVFIHLYRKGFIYRGQYIINWCPRCHTALSDEEAEHQQTQGTLYYIRYPFGNEPQQTITVATTRPETMLGDVAVAVHPQDERYRGFIGKTLRLPLVHREIPIIADDFVDPQFGTGAVKVTPAHDPNDFQIAQRHNLSCLNILHPDGRLNAHAQQFENLDRFVARQKIIAELQQQGLLEKTQAHLHAVGHCYRCQTIVEPYLSKQWFVKMKPLAKPAIEVVRKGKIKFYPERWTKVYLNWMTNIRDWCISRQIWWGHRIPVWYCQACGEDHPIVADRAPSSCPRCHGQNLIQDPDVLDTWFSSWLWPFATLGWPQKNPDLKYFYPTSVLFTAPEIIFFWVARMIMAGLEIQGKIPFSEVYIHGTVRDAQGRKMSKSLGNALDPLEIIQEYGADALRFSLIINSGQDLFISKEKFEVGRNFANKIWNAARLVLMQAPAKPVIWTQNDFRAIRRSDLPLACRWILSKLQTSIEHINEAIDSYKFSEAESLVYDFIWKNYCDWYLEIVKHQLNEKTIQAVSMYVLDQLLRLVHPFMPFVSDEIWSTLTGTQDSLAVQSWPQVDPRWHDKSAEAAMAKLMDVVTALRNIRAQWHIPPAARVSCILQCAPRDYELFDRHFSILETLAGAQDLTFTQVGIKARNLATAILNDLKLFVPLEGLVDISQEQKRIETEIENSRQACENLKRRLHDDHFLNKAPKDVVVKERERLSMLEKKLQELTAARQSLSDTV